MRRRWQCWQSLGGACPLLHCAPLVGNARKRSLSILCILMYIYIYRKLAWLGTDWNSCHCHFCGLQWLLNPVSHRTWLFVRKLRRRAYIASRISDIHRNTLSLRHQPILQQFLGRFEAKPETGWEVHQGSCSRRIKSCSLKLDIGSIWELSRTKECYVWRCL